MKPQKTKTVYSEKYFSRTVNVTRAEAIKIASEASRIYAVEQAEIEIPSLNNQRRIVCVMRFERIEKPNATDAVDPPVDSNTGTLTTRDKSS